MRQMKQWLMTGAAVLVLCGTMTGCKGSAQRPVNGTMDGPSDKGNPPEAVMEVCKRLAPTDDRLETELWDIPHSCPLRAQERVLAFFRKNL